MRTRSLTQALVGTAALLALAGCNSSSTAVESDPGELDWDVAVTRTAFLFGISPADGAYDPWQHGIVDFSDDNATRPATDEVFETGLEWLCDNFQATDASPMARIYVDAVAQEAAHAAVLATASDEFREANSVMFVQGSS